MNYILSTISHRILKDGAEGRTPEVLWDFYQLSVVPKPVPVSLNSWGPPGGSAMVMGCLSSRPNSISVVLYSWLQNLDHSSFYCKQHLFSLIRKFCPQRVNISGPPFDISCWGSDSKFLESGKLYQITGYNMYWNQAVAASHPRRIEMPLRH